MRSQETPQIHAGSMADIAFLLLIFFLVTTTIPNDQGILKRLPKEDGSSATVNERNVLEIELNSNNRIQLEGIQEIELSELKDAVIAFIDNGNDCEYCNGDKKAGSSDHPTKAVIVLQSSETAAYGTYVAIQNEITKAYNELRNTLAKNNYGRSLEELKKARTLNNNTVQIKEQLAEIRAFYPMLISEIE